MKNHIQYLRILTGLVIFLSFPFLLLDLVPLPNFLMLVAINFMLSYVAHKTFPEDKYFGG